MKINKLLMILVPVLCFVGAIIAFINLDKNEDAIKFKEEYESLNGEIAYQDTTYSSLNISKNNPIKYSNYDELIDVINNKSGIIYLGFPDCPWCRSAIPVLLDAANNNNINTIYYLNIKNERDSFIVVDDKLIYDVDENNKEIKGTKGYFKLMDVLDEHLTEYIISFEDKEYDTNEKRIYAPSVIFVKNGEVLGIHVSTVESHINPFDKLTNKQYEELYGIYEDYILEMKNNTCFKGSSC